MSITARHLELVPPWEPDAPMPDVLEDRTAVEFAMRRLHAIRAQMAANLADRDRMVAEADAWVMEVNDALEIRAAKEEWLIHGWMEARLRANPKGPKTETVPSGEVKWSKGSLICEVTDPDAFRVWAAANRPGLLRKWTPPPAPVPQPDAPDKNAIKAAVGTALRPLGDLEEPGEYGLAADDERIPGVMLVRHAPNIVIRPTDKEG